jgi:hypothetical protein
MLCLILAAASTGRMAQKRGHASFPVIARCLAAILPEKRDIPFLKRPD